MREIRLYNSLSKTKEALVVLEPPQVRIYSCGPTVYARQHLGNLRAYVFADVLGRSLRYLGYETRHVINITDVGHLTDDADAGDDKMEKAAREQRRSAREIADHWTELFMRDLARLGIEPPDVWARATDHIAEQIAMIQTLEAKGFTYATPDGVYFDTSKAPDYPAFGGATADDRQAQERVVGSQGKRSATDFALWKLSRGSERQMEWESPWGVGFPGWHIECSAMSCEHLGERFDIHTGGVDHLPVHHPNEIAQSEAAFGVRPWVTFWLHGGWLMMDGDKIAKSTHGSSAPNLDDVIAAGIDPAAFRLFLLSGHYRQQMNLGAEGLQAADDQLRRMRKRLRDGEGGKAGSADQVRERFAEALADDLNTPRALAVLHDALALEPSSRRELVAELDVVLGLGLLDREAELDAEIMALVEEREVARSERRFERADAIRAELAERGIEIEDTPDGPRPHRTQGGRVLAES